ncbi:hypothetical protein, partial [Rosenbergiella collisarenosi]|uniref:hypothetical protein n=1 Tax=Rosenbergiella collisarenosi TaxID=1544695 RepID=UPI001F5023F9
MKTNGAGPGTTILSLTMGTLPALWNVLSFSTVLFPFCSDTTGICTTLPHPVIHFTYEPAGTANQRDGLGKQTVAYQ